MLIGQSFDYDDSAGALYIYGSGLYISSTGAYGPASDFYFSRHSNETYSLANGVGDDRLAIQSNFGDITIYGFSAVADDVVNLAQVFSSYSAATAAMTSSDGDVIFKDAAADVLTLVGVDPASLSASRLGLT